MVLGLFGAALFYGDSMITPAISVLSAVEGLEVATPGAAALRRADGDRGADRSLPRAAPRYRPRRRAVRADHAALVFHPRIAGRVEHPPLPRGAGSAEPAICSAVLRRKRLARLLRAWVGRAGGDRRRGALRGHGPLRPRPHPLRVALLRAAGAAPQLSRAGRADPERSGSRAQSVLPAGAELGAVLRCSSSPPPRP